jgi:hypothetical protein
MDEQYDFEESDEEAGSRAPEGRDLVNICRELNRLEAKYLVIGGFAIIQAGYPRFTGDIDFLIDAELSNEAKVYEALRILPDQAVNELSPGEVSKFLVVRIGDEVTVDLMASASGIDFQEAEKSIEWRTLNGVRIPFASPELLWRMKCKTHREKDQADLLFLRRLIEASGGKVPE